MYPHFNLSPQLFGQSTAGDENGRLPSRPFILGAMSVYNEEEMIDQTIMHMQSQRVPLVVIDNGSTDGTFGILKNYPKDVIVELARIKTKHFTLGFLLRTLHLMISKYQPEWMLLLDADEFLEAPTPSMSLRDAIALESSKGFNLIQFDNFEFWPTEKDKDSKDKDIRRRIRYYSWKDAWQFKCFRNYPGTNIDLSGGHLPIFPRGIRVNLSPNKFVKRHYMILSYKHGIRKVFEERLPRYSEDEKKSWGIHRTYSKFGREQKYFVIDSSRLTEYHEDGKWVFDRKFYGNRVDEFPTLRTSEDIEIEMEKYRKSIESNTRTILDQHVRDLESILAGSGKDSRITARDERKEDEDLTSQLTYQVHHLQLLTIELNAEIGRLQDELKRREDHVKNIEELLQFRKAEIEAIHKSISWQVLRKYENFLHKARARSASTKAKP